MKDRWRGQRQGKWSEREYERKTNEDKAKDGWREAEGMVRRRKASSLPSCFV